jgi:hypothetical protein
VYSEVANVSLSLEFQKCKDEHYLQVPCECEAAPLENSAEIKKSRAPKLRLEAHPPTRFSIGEENTKDKAAREK